MIKKLLLLIVSFCSIHAMENTQRWKITCNKTNIHLTTDLFEACDNAHIIIAGKHEQNSFYACPGEAHDTIGCFYHSSHNNIYKNKDNKKRIHNAAFIKVVEPSLYTLTFINNKKRKKTFTYTVERQMAIAYFEAKQAIAEASKDLAGCYKGALDFGIQNYESLLSNAINDSAEFDTILKKPKSIALSSLSTNVGFPSDKAGIIAVKKVIKFIKTKQRKNELSYDEIYLAVNDTAQFNLYKKLLLKRTGLLHKIYLFNLGYMIDKESILIALPKELILYILSFIYKS